MPEAGGPVAVVPTAVAVAARRAATAEGGVERDDLRAAVREQPTGNLIVLVVDASGSMGADRRIAVAKGAALGLLADAYLRRDRVALIAFRGDRAEVVLRPTASVEVARVRLTELPTGGTTPLAAGLDTAALLVRTAAADQGLDPLLVVITDGRATAARDGLDPVAEARRAAAQLARARVPAVVIDAERMPRVGLARELADVLGADRVLLDDLADGQLERTIRGRLGTPPRA
jgi:magnesium chelatase subunit D